MCKQSHSCIQPLSFQSCGEWLLEVTEIAAGVPGHMNKGAWLGSPCGFCGGMKKSVYSWTEQGQHCMHQPGCEMLLQLRAFFLTCEFKKQPSNIRVCHKSKKMCSFSKRKSHIQCRSLSVISNTARIRFYECNSTLCIIIVDIGYFIKLLLVYLWLDTCREPSPHTEGTGTTWTQWSDRDTKTNLIHNKRPETSTVWLETRGSWGSSHLPSGARVLLPWRRPLLCVCFVGGSCRTTGDPGLKMW